MKETKVDQSSSRLHNHTHECTWPNFASMCFTNLKQVKTWVEDFSLPFNSENFALHIYLSSNKWLLSFYLFLI